MKSPTFKELPQLQTFIFVTDADNPLELDGRGYRGPTVVVKLNNEYWVSLGDLLAERKEDTAVRGQVIASTEAKAEVIPIDVGIPGRRLHELVVGVGLGHSLINLDRRR